MRKLLHTISLMLLHYFAEDPSASPLRVIHCRTAASIPRATFWQQVSSLAKCR